jgi:hypothetical protein
MLQVSFSVWAGEKRGDCINVEKIHNQNKKAGACKSGKQLQTWGKHRVFSMDYRFRSIMSFGTCTRTK